MHEAKLSCTEVESTQILILDANHFQKDFFTFQQYESMKVKENKDPGTLTMTPRSAAANCLSSANIAQAILENLLQSLLQFHH